MIFLFLMLFLGLVGAAVYRTLNVTKDKNGDAKLNPKFTRGLPYYAAALLPLFLMLSWTTVDSGSIGVVKRFGNPVRQLEPGGHFVRPFSDTVHEVATQTRVVKPNEQAASHDLQEIHVEVTFAYHVDPAFATYVLVTLNNEAETRVITPAILEAIKATTARFDAEKLITDRASVRDGIEDFVKVRLAPYHIIAETTSITDFGFRKEFNDAIEEKVTAQQKALQATNDLTRIKVEAEQKVARAEAEARSLRAQKEAITPELLQLRTIEMFDKKWNGTPPEVLVITGGGSENGGFLAGILRTRKK